MNMKIGVLGAGTWGIALGRMLARNGHDTVVWTKFPAEAEALRATRRHPNLPGVEIPQEVRFTTELAEACGGKDILLFAVPSVHVRETAELARPHVQRDALIVDAAKGIESGTLLTMTQVIRQVMTADGQHDGVRLVALSGPTHAEEVALDMPSLIVSASEDTAAAETVQDALMNTCLRAYTNTDVLGVEICGALKNIVALAAGMSAGLGYGDNARAALITRGMAEITRLGLAMGCQEQTFSGLAGVGDLIVTATSQHSRNNRAGMLIGQGKSPEEALREVGMVVEGVNALPAAIGLEQAYGVEMPIVEAVNAVVRGGRSPAEIGLALMTRARKPETVRPILGAVRGEMKRVMTYGAFDRIDDSTIPLLRHVKAMGDYLVVGLATDELGRRAGKPFAHSYEERRETLAAVRYVDLVVPVDSLEQPLRDREEFGIDTFAMGSSWRGVIDYLRDTGAEVVYLPDGGEKS